MCNDLMLLLEEQANAIQHLLRELALLQDYLPPTIEATTDQWSALQLVRVNAAREDLKRIGQAVKAHMERHGCGAM